jgi:dihydropteroate synthase
VLRRLHTWKIRDRELALGERTLIMGILNVTPDSFSDGGNYLEPDRAYAHAMQMEELGADIIDVGAESTRPGAHPISAEEELRRLVPVLKRLRNQVTVPISVDTYKADVAERALELGAAIINDPSGFTFDPLLAKQVVQHDAGVIFNHMRGRPETWASLGPLPDVMGSIVKDLDASVNRARRSGVDRLRIVVDPGIGFGKRREQNSEILARLEELARLELPIMVGPSRKSFLAQSGERETEFATAAAVTLSILSGAHIVRVHDVAEMKAAVSVADEVLRYLQRKAEEAREVVSAEMAARRARAGASPSPQMEASVPKPPVRPPVRPSGPRKGPPRDFRSRP